MNQKQNLIIEYIKTQWITSAIKIESIAEDKIRITDRTGDQMLLTCTDAGDIKEVDSERILAVRGTNGWITYPYPGVQK